MTTRQSPRQTRKRLRQSTLTGSQSPAPALASDAKRRRSSGSTGRGVWDDSRKGIMLYEPNAWRADEYAMLRGPSSLKIAAYDMDSTLITTKSRAKFPKSATDWQLLNSSIAPKIASLKRAGYIFVIFTNQAGISNKRITPDFVRSRVGGVMNALDVDAGVFVATTKDHFRKPGTGMWDIFVQLIGGVGHIDAKASFYVGDAAGRPARPGAVSDFSDSDLRFAINIGLRFQTPEEHFQGRKDAGVSTDTIAGFDPRVLSRAHNHPLLSEGADLDAVLSACVSPPAALDDLAAGSVGDGNEDGDNNATTPKKQTLVLMHGYPASGKTTFVKRHLVPKGYVWINLDAMQTVSRCTRAVRDALEKGKSVVIDNTNPDSNARSRYIELAKKHSKDTAIVCLCMATDVKLAKHLNTIRLWESQGSGPYVPLVAYHAYTKRAKRPVPSEGIDRIADVSFIPRFSTEQERFLFTRLS